MIRPSAVLAAIGAIALLVLPTACSDRGPAGPDAGLGQVQINASTNSPTVSALVIEVTAPDLSDPYVFNFTFVGGVAAGTIAVPAGGQRTITVRAYDVSGIQTHEGQATVQILPGANPTVHITLRPLNGQQPIEIALGSFMVAVVPTVATVVAGQTLQVDATVTDADGAVVGGTADVVWATDAPAVAAVDAAGLVTGQLEGSARIVASYGGVAAAAAVSVARIAFVSDRDGNQEIYVLNPDGSGFTNLTNNTANDNAFQWSPDGSQITFVSDRDGNTEVYVMSADGSGQTNLSNDGQGDFEPQWSPDGSKIAFSSWRFGVSDVFVVNADGTGLSDLTNDNGAFDGKSRWSPDGSKIAFRSDRDLNDEIYVMNADGSGVVNLTGNAARDDAPLWSPDGSKIAFVSDRGGTLDVYVMNADGTGQTDVSNSLLADDSLPQWSPDGSKLVFASNRDGNQEIYVVNVDGTGLARLTANTAFDDTPRWSPDGTRIAFVSDRDGDREVYVMNADGSGQTNLTNNAAADQDPWWHPVP